MDFWGESVGVIALDSFVILDRNVLVGLRGDLEEEFANVLEVSLQAMTERALAARDAIARQQVAFVRTAAHQIKSNSRQLGAMRVGRVAEQLEKLAATVPPPDLREWGGVLVDEVALANREILDFVASLPGEFAMPEAESVRDP
ncbi:MAG: Hpt domain-containing protein [Magnetococcales bacterium]|nr:Hpt domain-containing protein [Magnetococcales bacterium]MBF0321383.1 Hpt domain-containing protein [Magnetococcales bacterium]